MGMADIAEVLYNDFMRHNPANPEWFDRDRFVMSNGHGSMLPYSILHLSGYDVSIDDLSATFGGQLARGRFPLASRADQRVLAAAMVEAVDKQMRRAGIGWIEADFGLLLDEPALLAKLAVTHFNDTRAAIRRELGRLRLDRATGQIITGALIAHLMAQTDVHAANRTIEVLDDVFRSWLSGLGRVLADLAKHPTAYPQILKTSSETGDGLPELRATIAGLLES